MVRFLLRSGADVDCSTNAGYTPLHHAAQQGHTLIINLLLESKANPNAVSNVRLYNIININFIPNDVIFVIGLLFLKLIIFYNSSVMIHFKNYFYYVYF